MKRDFYEILGVEKNADKESLKRAYRRIALENHPDRNPGNREAEERFKEAAEAYDVLCDDEKREAYNRFGHDGLRGRSQGFSDAGDIFSAFGDIFGGSIFGDLFGRGSARGGSNLKCSIEVDFMEMVTGAEKTITLKRSEICEECKGSGAKAGTRPTECRHCGGSGMIARSQGFFSVRTGCPYCNGSGRHIEEPCKHCEGSGRRLIKREIQIRIPPGIEDGVTLRVTGEGEPGDDNRHRGDLYCSIRVNPHPVFQRDGSHVFVEAPITYPIAALGGSIEIPTLTGKRNLDIPAGTQSGAVFTVKGEGLKPMTGGDRRGDLLVRAVIETPAKLTKRQRELLEELGTLDEKNPAPNRKSFFRKIKDLFKEGG